ncbi:MAG: EF-P lysine aminoacylase EpmA [Deltaproteobacteria bacterium]
MLQEFPPTFIARCLGFDEPEEEIHFLWQEQQFSLQADQNLKITEGALVRFEFSKGKFIPKKVVYTPPAGLKANGDALRWRKLNQFPSRFHCLKARHHILRSIRNWFDQQGFLEVQTPARVKAPNPEAHFDLIQCDQGYLVTSPEFQMKRMLVGGFEKIYQINACYRGKEVGHWHNPEFTMLEWYRVGDNWQRLCQDLQEITKCLPRAWIDSKQHKMLEGEWKLTTVNDLLQEFWQFEIRPTDQAGDLLEKLKENGHEDWINQQRINAESFLVIFGRIWDELEKSLGWERPCLVTDWPPQLASLAQLNPSGFAERVECYVQGMEIANGFGELTDPNEQRKRFEIEIINRHQIGKIDVALDHHFLDALEEGMPPSCGMALGIERLLIWLLDTPSIENVIAFGESEIF